MKFEIHISQSWEIEAFSPEQALVIGKEIVRDNGAAFVKVYPLDDEAEAAMEKPARTAELDPALAARTSTPPGNGLIKRPAQTST